MLAAQSDARAGKGAKPERTNAGLPLQAPAASAAGEATDRAWYAVWTRSHAEHLVRDQLASKGFEVFLPKAVAWTRRPRGRRVLEVPLFPSYLFVHHGMDKPSHVEILKARGVVRVLGERWDRLTPIPEAEIESVRRVLDGDAPVLPYPQLAAGRRVRITHGALQGVEGVFVESRPSKGLLVVSINLLQRSVAVEVDCTLVEPA